MEIRRIAFWASALLLVACPAVKADNANPPAHRSLRISMFSGSAEYQSDQTLAKLKNYLDQRYVVRCVVNDVKDIHDLPGIEQLETCDVIVVFTRRLELPPEQIAKIKKYMEAGKPVIGIRTASHAFQTWLAFDHEVLGGDYQGHAVDGLLAHIRIDQKAAAHPVLHDVDGFTTNGKLYTNPQLAEGVKLLLTADTGKNKQPVAWVRIRPGHHNQRIFYTSLGVQADFENRNFLKLLSNAIFWAAAVPAVTRDAPARN
jgi:type 1 glutamine amidotransferase